MSDGASQTRSVDVLIIGGGFTGLTAARELQQRGINALLLEGSADHLGGRAYGYKIRPTPNPHEMSFDHGAEYVGDLQNEIMSVIRDVSPGALVNGAAMRYPYPYEVMVLGGKRYCYPVDESLFGIGGVPPTIGFWDVLGMLALLQEIVAVEQQIDVVEPWNSPAELQVLDLITLETWFSRDWVSEVARDLMRISIEALLSIEATQVSPFYVFFYTACNNGFLYEINDNAGGPQQYWMSSGMSEVAERYAQPLAGRIHRGVRATSIDASGDRVHVMATDGYLYSAKKVIVAASPNTAGRIQYRPALPSGRRALMDAPMGRTIKCQIFYRAPWWRDSHGLAYDGYVGGAGFEVLWVMDNSAGQQGDAYTLMTFTVGAQAEKLGPHPTKDQVKKLVTEGLCFLFNDTRALSTSAEFIDLVMFDWSPTSFTGGGPNTIMTPGMLTGPDCPARSLNEPWLDKVFFASSENARNPKPSSKQPTYDPGFEDHMPAYDASGTRLPGSLPPFRSKYSDMRQGLGYMDGAIISGRYVAKQVADSLQSGASRPAPRPSQPVVPAAPIQTAGGASAAGPAGLDPSALDPSSALPPISPADTLAILADICSAVADGSKVELDAWMKQRWATNPDALQNWLMTVVVTALAQHGQIQDPTNPMQVLLAIENFTRYGLEYSTAAGGAGADGPTLVAIQKMTGVANALMQAKSSEPFVVQNDVGDSVSTSARPEPQNPEVPAATGPRRPGGRLASLLASLFS